MVEVGDEAQAPRALSLSLFPLRRAPRAQVLDKVGFAINPKQAQRLVAEADDGTGGSDAKGISFDQFLIFVKVRFDYCYYYCYYHYYYHES